MGIINSLKSLFLRKADPFAENMTPFLKGVRSLLKDHEISHARSVGGVFRLKPADQISEPLLKRFERAVVLLSDQHGAVAIPMIAGQKRDGDFELVSIINWARPQDIRATDRLDARRMAHMGRLNLEVTGTLIAPEYPRMLTPA